MINHARTLLLNVSGQTSSREELGEEYIPASFAPVPMPGYLQSLRNVLFGTSPDRYFLNYRARELMQLLHATELAEYVYKLDPRVTYWPEPRPVFFGPAERTTIEQINGPTTTSLLFFGSPRVDTFCGRARYTYDVSVETGEIEATRVNIRVDKTDHYTEITDTNLSQVISVPGAAQKLRVKTPVAGSRWTVTTLARPAPVLTTLMPILELIGEPVMIGLFGVANVEPYATFRNLWFDHPLPVYKLGGLILAAIYRTDELNQNGAR